MMKEVLFGKSSCKIWVDGPLWHGEPASTIGHLKIANPQEGAELLSRAISELKNAGARAILAPMDGDTWHSYRVIVETDDSPPYALEPLSREFDYGALKSNGFTELEYYSSGIAPVPPAGSENPAVDGVNIVQWDGVGAENLLEQLYDMASGSFADKLFFKPISKEDFLELYRPLLSMLDPRLVLFAYNSDGKLVGFLFGVPDFMEGIKPTRAIIKTYASLKYGVGRMLAWQFHELAREMGFSHVIHALMHQGNISLDRSQKHEGRVFRKYAIMGKKI